MTHNISPSSGSLPSAVTVLVSFTACLAFFLDFFPCKKRNHGHKVENNSGVSDKRKDGGGATIEILCSTYDFASKNNNWASEPRHSNEHAQAKSIYKWNYTHCPRLPKWYRSYLQALFPSLSVYTITSSHFRTFRTTVCVILWYGIIWQAAPCTILHDSAAYAS